MSDNLDITPLPALTKTALAEMRDNLAKAKLGHFGRRIQMLVEQAHESRETYAKESIVLRHGTAKVTVPIKSRIAITAEVEVGDARFVYTYDVGSMADAPRNETPLTDFAPEIVTQPL